MLLLRCADLIRFGLGLARFWLVLAFTRRRQPPRRSDVILCMRTIWEQQRDAQAPGSSVSTSSRKTRPASRTFFLFESFLFAFACLSSLTDHTRGGDIAYGFSCFDIVLPCAFSLAFMIGFVCWDGQTQTSVSLREPSSPLVTVVVSRLVLPSNCRVPQACQLNQCRETLLNFRASWGQLTWQVRD